MCRVYFLIAIKLVSLSPSILSFTWSAKNTISRPAGNTVLSWKRRQEKHKNVRPSFRFLRTSASAIEQEDWTRKDDYRTVIKLEKYTRLPIWPLWNGVLIFFLSKLPFMSLERIAELEALIGGRVCPMPFPQEDISAQTFKTSPFIMLVHHVHNFHPWDPLRYIQRFFFPEGFPAHPHRGFCTITYCLHGGMIHRDSMGIRQIYGASRDHSTQLLVAGKGVLHEEMWDTSIDSKQELFQLWLNLPAKFKMITPAIQLLARRDDSMPTVVEYTMQGQDKIKMSSTLVIAGSYNEHQSTMTLFSDITILHVHIFRIPSLNIDEERQRTPFWRYHLPDHYRTAILYVRSGSINISGTRVPPHHTVFLSQTGNELAVSLDQHYRPFASSYGVNSPEQHVGADFIVMAARPLDEPVVVEGSMVMNSYNEIYQAYQDYQTGAFGLPWKETLSNDEWRDHVKKYGSM